jgi:phosphopentomutase
VPLLVYGENVKQNLNLGTRGSFADIAKTIADLFGLDAQNLDGKSFSDEIV